MAAEDYFNLYEERDHEDIDDDDYRAPRRHYPPFWLLGRHTGVATDRAVLWQFLDGTEQWFPRSQLIEIQQTKMLISGWIQLQKGITEKHNQQPINNEPPPVKSIEEYGFYGCEPDQ